MFMKIEGHKIGLSSVEGVMVTARMGGDVNTIHQAIRMECGTDLSGRLQQQLLQQEGQDDRLQCTDVCRPWRLLMALVRCDIHGKPRGTACVAHRLPVGYPNQSAAICGRKGCTNPGVLWLKVNEDAQYQNGMRIFDLPPPAVRIMVQQGFVLHHLA